MASDFDMKKDSNRQWYWVFNGKNGEALARSSESYINRQDCLHCIRLVKDIAPGATVWDLSTPGSPVQVPASEVK
jgi:uncharacterized protein YegP (UPF0339 family)